MILIGSRALKLRASYLLDRPCIDFDFICYQEQYEQWMKDNSHKIEPSKITFLESKNKMIVEGKVNCEFELVKEGTSSKLFYDLVEQDDSTIQTPFGMIPNLDLLFTLKSSHKYLKNSPYFWKTLVDYHKMKMVGATVKPEYKDFLKLREKETYDYSHPNLKQNKKEFFNETDDFYKYDHDSIHQAVKVLDKPAYTYFSIDGEEVSSSKEKFFNCDRNIQLLSVAEESAVLAIERSLVPHPGVMEEPQAWRFALSKVCTSITSGWFRAFAYENIFDVLNIYPDDYKNKFDIGLQNGIVKPFKKDL
jgi:hypothetical protein